MIRNKGGNVLSPDRDCITLFDTINILNEEINNQFFYAKCQNPLDFTSIISYNFLMGELTVLPEKSMKQ